MGQRPVRAGLHLAAEVLEVRARIGCLRVHLRISGHLDLEVISVRLADEADQLTGIVELSRRRGAHGSGRQVAAQGHNAGDARFPIPRQQTGDVGPRRTYARQVWHSLHAAMLHHRQKRLVRPVLPGTTGAVGN